MDLQTPQEFWLIEDDEPYRDNLEMALKSFYPRTKITCFSTEQDGLKKIKEVESSAGSFPALVLSDVQMPVSFESSAEKIIGPIAADAEPAFKQSGLRLRKAFREAKVEGCDLIPWAFLTVREKSKIELLDDDYRRDPYAWHMSKNEDLYGIKDKIDAMLSNPKNKDKNKDELGVWLESEETETSAVTANPDFLAKIMRGLATPLSDCNPRPSYS